MLLSSNGRTPVFQTDVDAGSIPVKSTTRPCRLRWLGHHPLKVKKADRHRSGLQKYLVILNYCLIFVKQIKNKMTSKTKTNIVFGLIFGLVGILGILGITMFIGIM